MRLMLMAGLLVAAGATTAASSQALKSVRFGGGQAQSAQLQGAEAIAYGADGTPAFRGSQNFIFGFAGNPGGRVYEWDLAGQKVRISAPDQSPVWLSCADLKPMALACASSLRVANDGVLMVEDRRPMRNGARGEENMPAGALPSCPGDPRCPRIGG